MLLLLPLDVACSSAAEEVPREWLWSRRAMAEAPASVRAWAMLKPRPRAPLRKGERDKREGG